MEFKAEANPRISLTLDGFAEITFKTTRGALPSLEDLKDKDLLVKVSSFSKRRSLSQNAYMWVLLGEIADCLKLSKEEVYKNYIKDYGKYEVLPIKNEAVETFIKIWKGHGLGWVAEELRESKLSGYTNVIAYYGSSTYSSEDMTKLIEPIIRECEELGINTMSMADIMLLKNENDVTGK